MKLALLSDIHANLPAFDACLEFAATQGVDQYAILGDLVGYGPNPCEVIERVVELQIKGAWVVRGNHDDEALELPQPAQDYGSLSANWTYHALTREHRAFIQGLPYTMVHEHLLFVHASARNPESWEYVENTTKAQRCVDSAKADFDVQQVFVGHVHQQSLYYPGANGSMMRFDPIAGGTIPCPKRRAMVATVGSVGQPRDGNTAAMMAIYDTRKAALTFHRVHYDCMQVAQQIRELGLPEALASRLESGR